MLTVCYILYIHYMNIPLIDKSPALLMTGVCVSVRE